MNELQKVLLLLCFFVGFVVVGHIIFDAIELFFRKKK
jgi:hypothetical protein